MSPDARARIEADTGLTHEDAIARVLRRVRPWIEAETPSGNERALAALSERIEEELHALGATCDAFLTSGLGRTLSAVFPGREPALEPIVILGHIDTVHPVGTLERQPFDVVDGRATGPGIFDMKAGIALMVEALALLIGRGTRPRRTVRMLVTCDEEIGSHASRALIREAAEGAAAALVPEPSLPDGSAKTRRKGVSTYRMTISGRAAHAGVDPERAVSATAELAHQILAVLALADPAQGTTVNIGLVEGGTATNTVPAAARAAIDVRFVSPAEGERVAAALATLPARLPGAVVRVELTETRPPLERTDGVVRLYEHARTQAEALGMSLGEGATGGGSDGSLIATYGLPVLDGLGPRGGGAHAVDEHILIDDLPFRLALYTRLLDTL